MDLDRREEMPASRRGRVMDDLAPFLIIGAVVIVGMVLARRYEKRVFRELFGWHPDDDEDDK